MAKNNYKLAKGQYVSNVINPGLDKNMPIGSVDVVYNADGSMAGFLRGKTFYNPGEKVPESKASGAPKISAADMYQAQLESDPIYIQKQIDKWSGLATEWISGSDHQTALNNLKTWQDKLDAIQTPQEQAGQAKEAQAAASLSKEKITKDQTDLQKLQAQLNVATIKRENTADIQSKIDALNTKIGNEKPAAQGPGIPAANATELTPAPFGGMQNAQGAVQNVKGTPPAPGPVSQTPIGQSGTTSTSPTPTPISSSGKYTTKNGVLNYNGQPFTGQKDGTYYADGKVESAEQIKKDFFTKFGVQAALIASDPGLSTLFTQAIKENWAPAKWGTEFQNSAWAKARNATQQKADIQRVSSPQDYAQAYNRAQQQAISTASALGFDLTDAQKGSTIDPANMNAVHQSDPTGQDLAEWIVRNNPTTLELNAHLAQVGKVNATLTGGQIQTYAQTLKQTAMDLGVSNMILPPSSGGDYFTDAAKSIVAGTTDINKQTEYLRQQAIKLFPAYANQIESGISVKSLAAPYINSLTNLLEVTDPSQIDLGQTTGYGAMITKALQGNNDPKNPVPMDLSTFQNQVRALPQWMNTTNAKTSIMDSGTQFLKSMGLIR